MKSSMPMREELYRKYGIVEDEEKKAVALQA